MSEDDEGDDREHDCQPVDEGDVCDELVHVGGDQVQARYQALLRQAASVEVNECEPTRGFM